MLGARALLGQRRGQGSACATCGYPNDGPCPDLAGTVAAFQVGPVWRSRSCCRHGPRLSILPRGAGPAGHDGDPSTAAGCAGLGGRASFSRCGLGPSRSGGLGCHGAAISLRTRSPGTGPWSCAVTRTATDSPPWVHLTARPHAAVVGEHLHPQRTERFRGIVGRLGMRIVGVERTLVAGQDWRGRPRVSQARYRRLSRV
jgi:hypothetical protein